MKYNPPYPSTITRNIKITALSLTENLQSFFKEFDGPLSLALDHWKCTVNQRVFLEIIVAHLESNSQTIKSRVINVNEVFDK